MAEGDPFGKSLLLNNVRKQYIIDTLFNSGHVLGCSTLQETKLCIE